MDDVAKTREALVAEITALRERLADFERRARQHQKTEAALRAIQKELEKLNEELESRVRARTADLEAANRELRNEIAERQRAEQSLLEAEADRISLALEKERGAMLRLLVGNIAHDVKTPLAAITMSLYLLEKHTDPAKRQEKIDDVKVQVHILEAFIQDLLAISRLDSEPELHFTWIDVNMVLSSIQESLRPVIERRQIQISAELAHSLPQIEADYADVRRALVNLIENAITYTPESGSVSIKTRSEGDSHVCIEVTDTGIGVSDDDLPRIFDRFYRAPAAQALMDAGSGIGLAIVKKVIDLHNGDVTVDSAVGQGSTFTITLPIQQVKPVD